MACTDAASHPARIIAMLNQKGGVGKTTSTVNIGAAIALSGRRVCLIDLDPQAHLTLHLGIDLEPEERPTVYDLFVDPEVTAAAATVQVRDNLDVIPADVDLAAVDVELAHHPSRERILQEKFAAVGDTYDFVLIDCPPSLGLLTLNALALAGEVIVPMQAHFLALQGVGKLLQTVGLVCRSVNPALSVNAVLLCMHEGQTTLAKEIVADLEGFFQRSRDEDVPWRNCRVLQPAIRRNIKLAEAPSFGQTIFDYAPWCPGAIDYRLLAERIVAESDRRRQAASVEVDDEPAPRPAPTTIEQKPTPAQAAPARVVEPVAAVTEATAPILDASPQG